MARGAVHGAERLLCCSKPCHPFRLTRFEIGQCRPDAAHGYRRNDRHDDRFAQIEFCVGKQSCVVPDAVGDLPDDRIVVLAIGKADDDRGGQRHDCSPQLRHSTRAGAGLATISDWPSSRRSPTDTSLSNRKYLLVSLTCP